MKRTRRPTVRERYLHDNPQIRVVMMPKDTNAMGNIFGGVILSHIDLAAAEHARTIAPHLYVTKVMREIDFIAPVKVGDTVSYYAQTRAIGRTSITIRVMVTAERGIGKRHAIKVTDSEVVMVAVDESGQPISVLSEGWKPTRVRRKRKRGRR